MWLWIDWHRLINVCGLLENVTVNRLAHTYSCVLSTRQCDFTNRIPYAHAIKEQPHIPTTPSDHPLKSAKRRRPNVAGQTSPLHPLDDFFYTCSIRSICHAHYECLVIGGDWVCVRSAMAMTSDIKRYVRRLCENHTKTVKNGETSPAKRRTQHPPWRSPHPTPPGWKP